MHRGSHPHAHPARKVFYDWDEVTRPDYKLAAAFERTNPGFEIVDEDEPTFVRWVLPALGVLAVGFFIGRWWAGRKVTVAGTPSTVTAVGNDLSGFDLLGCESLS